MPYFDHNATTPLRPAAREAWLEAADRFWHNPSSLYPEAGAARQRLEDEREALADLLGADDPEDLVFTSGATEANNAVFAHYSRPGQLATCALSAIEHPSVIGPAQRDFAGGAISPIPVDAGGQIEVGELQRSLRTAPTTLVSLMAANNETGALQPCGEAFAAARAAGAVTHCDASQWFGKLPAAGVAALGADITVGSGHKFGAPRGVGFALLAGAGRDLRLQTGGPQEARRRAGTEDLPAIAAMVAALAEAESQLADMRAQAPLRDAFEEQFASTLPGAGAVLPRGRDRLPNTSAVLVPRGKNLRWLTRLGRLGFAVSTGSACSSGAENGSHVLAAMGLSADAIKRSLRISSGANTSAADWDGLLGALRCVAADFPG